jgi:hypothetical protein
MSKYQVVINEGNGWEDQGEGPFSLKTAERIAREIDKNVDAKQ